MSEPQISDDSVLAAQALLGVAFTDAERAQMLDSLAAQLARARRRRATTLPADLVPALRFDPRLPGFAMPPPEAFQPDPPPPGPLPAADADIAFATVGELGGWIRSGAISSERLTRLYLERIARLGPGLECIALVTAELALAQARAADRLLAAGHWLGPLHGIPYGCKDLLDTADLPTRWGAEPYLDRVPETNATVVRRLAEAGAVLIAKTSLGALAYGDIWHGGTTRNPWNRAEGSSGSSAGSGSGTAAGLFGFAIGTETLGSIVSPATRCGVAGLRPTFGRVSRAGAMALCWSLDKVGPMTRCVDDTALVLSVLNGFDAADVASIDAPFGYDALVPVTGLRVGYFEADLDDPIDQASVDALRGLDVEMVALERPDLPYASLLDVLYAEAAAAFEELTLSDRDDLLAWQDEVSWPNRFRAARFLSAVDLIQLDRLRRLVMQVADGWFQSVDAIIGGPAAGPMSIITNFSGHPCLVQRAGFRMSPTRLQRGIGALQVTAPGEVHRVPHSVCLWGRLFDEGTILRLGRALEQALDVRVERPPGCV
jgi:Asp-tRNA(Asn)/Glu-tRNA(Gln) amidotransferase A subunit family amidase